MTRLMIEAGAVSFEIELTDCPTAQALAA